MHTRITTHSRPVRLMVLTVASVLAAMLFTISMASKAAAAPTGPSISVSGKGCPKSGSSSWNRRMKISDKAKANSKICIIKTNNGANGVNLNAKYTSKKHNDYRFDEYVKMTGYTTAHHVTTDGLQEWWITAYAYSVKLSGQEPQYPDEHGTVWFYNVPGKAFSINVRWVLQTKYRYWDNNRAQFVTEYSSGYVTMKTVRFKSVTKTK